jgi:hypothetical protein
VLVFLSTGLRRENLLNLDLEQLRPNTVEELRQGALGAPDASGDEVGKSQSASSCVDDSWLRAALCCLPRYHLTS